MVISFIHKGRKKMSKKARKLFSGTLCLTVMRASFYMGDHYKGFSTIGVGDLGEKY